MNADRERMSDGGQRTPGLTRRRLLGQSGAALAALGLAGAMGLTAQAPAHASEREQAASARGEGDKPIIVLVHGAWADGSSWSKVISRLLDDDYAVVAPAVGLLSLSADIASVRKVIADLGAPTLVVGHSYGGAVITGAASGLANVKGLVYVAGFAPDTGECLLSLATQFDAQYGPVAAAQYYRPRRPFDAQHPQTLVYLDRAHYGEVFVQDIDRTRAAVLAVAQRPISLACFGEPLQVEPAWRQVRTWYQVSSQDRAIGPGGERFFAGRMRAETIEIDSSHASLVSHPGVIARLIKRAAQAVV